MFSLKMEKITFRKKKKKKQKASAGHVVWHPKSHNSIKNYIRLQIKFHLFVIKKCFEFSSFFLLYAIRDS